VGSGGREGSKGSVGVTETARMQLAAGDLARPLIEGGAMGNAHFGDGDPLGLARRKEGLCADAAGHRLPLAAAIPDRGPAARDSRGQAGLVDDGAPSGAIIPGVRR